MNIKIKKQHYALFRLYECEALAVFPLRHAVAASISFLWGKKNCRLVKRHLLPHSYLNGAKISDSSQSCKESPKFLREFKDLSLDVNTSTGLRVVATLAVTGCLRLLLCFLLVIVLSGSPAE